jgi:flavodoxin I
VKIGVFFGSTSYGTKEAAETVRAEFSRQSPGSAVELRNVAKSRAEDLAPFDLLVLGTSTWGIGGLQHDWDAFIWELDRADLSGKNVALFALGDQVTWAETFVDSMAIVFETAVKRGAAVIGSWPTSGYTFARSKAVREGRFVGLPLDRMNQRELTADRVRAWASQVLAEAQGGS